jgi:hypothetical protein
LSKSTRHAAGGKQICFNVMSSWTQRKSEEIFIQKKTYVRRLAAAHANDQKRL